MQGCFCRVPPVALGRGERVKHRRLLDRCEVKEEEPEAVKAMHQPRTETAPLAPGQRAALVEQAIADLEAREERMQREQEACHKFGLTSTPQWQGQKRGYGAAGANGPERGASPQIKRPRAEREDILRMEPPPPSSGDEISDDDEALADADCLDLQLRVMTRMQRKIAALERRLEGRRQRLREATDRYEATIAELDKRRGMDEPGRRRPAETLRVRGARPDPDPILVLHRERDEVLEELPPGDDMLTLPTDLPMALRVISRLRLEVMALRSRVLQRAFRNVTHRVEMMQVNEGHARAEIRWMDSLDAVFTPAQKARVRPDCRMVPWAREDYLKAIALRWVCRRSTFDYVRNTMRIPLPSMYSVRAVAAFGRFPEVTQRYKELTEHKRLRFTRAPSADADSDATS
ncbi:uncharacterized protein LOC119107351 [Pollicipes pollicipes]|uniref:uncharacterized protein LOC119107351 n=1 Tax=Pollicipes pollicipes TaxID=41117 RepID=UPI001884D4ED|nr:uncharacterized protein LOC119107351 [Pollicipes pollicipes]